MINRSLQIRTLVILVITLVGVYVVFGPRRTPNAQDFTWNGIKANLEENINLGLDLKGGSHLVMRVLTDDYLKTLTENNAQAALTAVQDAKITTTGNNVVAERHILNIHTGFRPAQAATVAEEVKKRVDLFSWTESVSGNTVSWNLPSATQTLLKNQAVDQALKIIETRVDAFGVQEPTLQRHGAESSAQILLQMPGVDDPKRLKDLLDAESNLTLAKIVSQPNPSPVQTYPTREAAFNHSAALFRLTDRYSNTRIATSHNDAGGNRSSAAMGG